MNTYKQQENTSLAAAARNLQQKENNTALRLSDNRPRAVTQRKLNGLLNTRPQQTIQKKAANAVIQREKTVSGHGNLRVDEDNNFVPYTVPQGKTIVLSAPPGATLGDISMVLNETANPNPDVLRTLIKINTDDAIWTNTIALQLVLDDPAVEKTQVMEDALKKLINDTDFEDLLSTEKRSLKFLEKRPSFELWAHNYVAPHTFKVINEGEEVWDMDLKKFEPHLKSRNSAQQNDYIENATTLSGYVGAHPGENRFVINACSASYGAPFTGFQIDLA